MLSFCYTPLLDPSERPGYSVAGDRDAPGRDKTTALAVRTIRGIRGTNGMSSRLTWPQICRSSEFRGRWVALDECNYDPRTARPVEGTVVDADEDLVALCARMQDSDNRRCAILFCEERDESAPRSSRPTPMPPRAYH